MEIQDFVKKTELVPLAELTTLAAQRSAFGDDVIAGFRTQIELRNTAAQKVLETASQANRDSLLASEQRSYDAAIRERDAILGLQRNVEQRTEQRAFVPATQTPTTSVETADLSPVLSSEQRSTDWLKQRGRFAYQEPGAEQMRLGKFVAAMVTGNRSQLSDLEKRVLSEGTDSAGGFTVPEVVASQFIDRTRNQTVVMKAGARTVPMTSDTLHMARLATGLTPTPTWKLENNPITASDITLERVTFTAHTLPILVKMSVELFEDSTNISEIVEQEMSAFTALELDRVALVGSGTAPEPRGIKFTTGVLTGTYPATIANWDWLVDAMGALWGQNEEPNALIGGTALAISLAKLKAGDSGQPLDPPLALLELKKFRTAAAGTNAFLGDFTQLLIGMRTSFRVEISREAGDAFTNLQVWVRSYLRADVQVARPKAFNVLSAGAE